MREDIDVSPDHPLNETPSTAAAPSSSPQPDAGRAVRNADAGTPEIVEEVLVEEVSIDGMCGVY
jgi:mycofactocin precursor